MTATLQETGESILYTNASTASTIESGRPIQVGAVLGITSEEILPEAEGALTVQDVHSVRKDSSVFARGDSVYWDEDGTSVGADTGCVTLISTGNQFCGVAWEAAIATATTVDVKLMVAGTESGEVEVKFQSEPITAKVGGGAAGGTDGDENVMVIDGVAFVYHIIGTATKTAPLLIAAGLDISLDNTTATDGIELVEGGGILARSPSAKVVGAAPIYTSQAVTIATVAGTAQCFVGFRKVEAFQADPTANYTDFALIGNVSGDIKTSTDKNNSGTAVVTDTTDDWADGEEHTLEVQVDVAGAVTYRLDGAAPTVVAAFSFDVGDSIVPIIYNIHDTGGAGVISLAHYKRGSQL